MKLYLYCQSLSVTVFRIVTLSQSDLFVLLSSHYFRKCQQIREMTVPGTNEINQGFTLLIRDLTVGGETTNNMDMKHHDTT